jgi:hypothetical protein
MYIHYTILLFFKLLLDKTISVRPYGVNNKMINECGATGVNRMAIPKPLDQHQVEEAPSAYMAIKFG